MASANVSDGPQHINSTEQHEKAAVDEKQRSGEQFFGHKSMLQSDALYQYVLDTSVYPRESPYQRELREITAKHPRSVIAVAPDEAQFLMLLIKLINAKNTMELGVFTGYSLLSTALALPDDGKIIAMDLDRETYELGAPVMEKAGVIHKVDFREGLILPQLDEMLLQVEIHAIDHSKHDMFSQTHDTQNLHRQSFRHFYSPLGKRPLFESFSLYY